MKFPFAEHTRKVSNVVRGLVQRDGARIAVSWRKLQALDLRRRGRIDGVEWSVEFSTGDR
jgi:hypothetical protein